MRFKVDENLPQEVAAVLRSAGHDALTLLDQGAAGSPDAVLATLLQRERRALLTLDLGFGTSDCIRRISTQASWSCT
jgi:predicted nuclease of predicted toxin-antitoxin system